MLQNVLVIMRNQTQMSPHNITLILSKRSIQDLEDILLYSFQKWGQQQMNIYQSALDTGLITINKNPLIGYKHQNLPNNYRIFGINQHIVIYKIIDTTIFVIRVLHSRMDLEKNLQ